MYIARRCLREGFSCTYKAFREALAKSSINSKPPERRSDPPRKTVANWLKKDRNPMAHPNSYRRPAFINRPWITGGLYDLLASKVVLHCDAYVFVFGRREYLQLEYREGGKTLYASDTWLIDADGLTPVWSLGRDAGALTYNGNPALHARVIRQVRELEAQDQWARISLLCHYIDAREQDAETGLTRVTRARRDDISNLPDVL